MAMVHSSVYRTIKRHITDVFTSYVLIYSYDKHIMQTKSISFQHWSNFTTKKGNSLVCWRNLNSKGGLWIKFTTLQGSAVEAIAIPLKCNSTAFAVMCIQCSIFAVLSSTVKNIYSFVLSAVCYICSSKKYMQWHRFAVL